MTVKKRFVHQLNNITPIEADFDKLLEGVDTSHIKEGTVVKGQVVDVARDHIIVDVGLKNECRIPIAEFAFSENEERPSAGDLVDVFVERIEGRRGTILSREKALREESWTNLEKLFDAKENVIGKIQGRVKGGFSVELKGVIAFLPGSQVDVRPIKDPSSIIDIEQPFQILKMDKKLGNIVVSRRAILEESRSEARDEMLAKIKEGMVLKGIVKNITDYGAFVDLGSIDGLLHVTDISWTRINHPSEKLTFGQEVEVMVVKFNEETKRISLGMKQLEDNPWKDITEEFPVGKKMKGKVTNIADYGAFIELKTGVEGLVHSSELAWGKNVQNPKRILSIGQELEFVIIDVDTEKNRISLSVKKCQDNPIVAFAEKNPVGSTFKTKIRNVTDFALFVEISDNVDGMIHESDLSWDQNGNELLKNYNKGDDIECKVLSVDIEKEKVALGVKQLTDDPCENLFGKFSKNMTATCVVTDIQEDGIEVEVEGEVQGFIKRGDLASDKTEQRTNRFAVGDRVDAKVTYIDRVNKRLNLSIKYLEMDQRDKAIKEYGSTDSGASLGDILGAALSEGAKSEKK